jgi:splicing factor 1
MATEQRGRTFTTNSTKWDDHGSKTFVPGIPTFIPANLSKEELDTLLLRIRIEEIGYKLQNNQLDLEYFRDRSLSPTPVYDKMGKRVNTREQRARNRLMNERHILIEKALTINPLFRPPADYRPLMNKRNKKLYIPLKEYPDYNFIGLIIGPRGYTQKQMEQESGARIAIRGKGSLKEGKGKTQNNEDDDDLHVLITADTEDAIKKATQMVKRLLIPVEEGKNDHKKQQLRKLAEINGTLRDNAWNQPILRTWTSPDVYCKHCGEISHPTYDCPLKDQPVNKQVIDKEYQDFMNEIVNGDGNPKTDTEKNYEQFMTELNNESDQKNNWKQQQQQQQGQWGGYNPYGSWMPPPPHGSNYHYPPPPHGNY